MKTSGARRVTWAGGFAAVALIVAGLPLSGSAFGDQDGSPPPTARSRTGGETPDPAPPPPGSARIRAAGAGSGSVSGPGWASGGATRLLADGYVIRFLDRRAAEWLGPYVRASAAELARITGLSISVDPEPAGYAYPRSRGEIVVGALAGPCVVPADGGAWRAVTDGSGTPGWSCGFHARGVPDTVTGGHAYIDTSFFTAEGKPIARLGEAGMRNHISHELGHTLGLGHADDAPGGCVRGADSGEAPVMCTVSNGYQDSRAGQYVQQFDVQGLRALAEAGGAPVPPQGRVTGLGGRCLGVAGGRPANGTPIRLRDCDGGVGQSWIVEKDGTLRAMGKCLDDLGNGAADGNGIDLFDCNGTAAQKWAVDARGRLVHLASGKALDLAAAGSTDDGAVVLNTPGRGRGQLWTVPK
ncbi:ricin-type beta-trefoil lectin domain protein [Embleya scabrispora]|uniref:ricin-type beta-trefoil lectin domain protein n=1 Tax=Embleya scabrispora TaxID=159449 RepID=UPI001F22C6CC|nr:ricin-type beta-trefoil lectin domain protein [Embleya scabrispora]